MAVYLRPQVSCRLAEWQTYPFFNWTELMMAELISARGIEVIFPEPKIIGFYEVEV